MLCSSDNLSMKRIAFALGGLQIDIISNVQLSLIVSMFVFQWLGGINYFGFENI